MAETSDPFDTQATLPLKPALRLQGAQGSPCEDALPKHPLNLFEVVNFALCNNPQTREVWASARVQAAQVGINKAAYLPNLAATAGLNRNWLSNGAAYNQRNAGLSLSYLLYDFGARTANLESAKQLLSAASYSQDSLVQAIFLAAIQSYYQTQASTAAFDATRESEAAAQASFAAAQARYIAGTATPTDKLAAQTAYSQATLNRITAYGAQQNARGTLANVLGLDLPQKIKLQAADQLAAPADFQRNISALIDLARESRPDLQAAAAQLQAAQANTDAVRAAARPTVSLNTSTNYSGVMGNGLNHTSTLGINLNVPIFSGYAPTYRIRAAEAQAEVKQAQLDKLNLQIALDVWLAYQNLSTATQALKTTSDLLRSATQSAQMTAGRYKAGVGIMLDVLSAQSTLANARQQDIQARFNWNINRAVLAQAMGNLNGDLLQTLSDASHENLYKQTP